MTHFILIVGDWRNDSRTPSASEYDNMIDAINGSGCKYVIGVGDYKPVKTGYEIDKILAKITIPKYFIPGNHDSTNCDTLTNGVQGQYFSSIENTGIQAEFANSCSQQDFTQINDTGNPAIVVRHVANWKCSGCSKGTASINLPSNTVLCATGDTHCPGISGTSTRIDINESSPVGQPDLRGCPSKTCNSGTGLPCHGMSYVEFDDSVSGKLTVRAKRITAQSAVVKPTSWTKEITVDINTTTTCNNPVFDFKLT